MRIFGRQVPNPFQRNGNGSVATPEKPVGGNLHRGRPAGASGDFTGLGESSRAKWDADDTSDLKQPPQTTPDETTIAAMLKERMRSAQSQRKPHEWKYKRSLAYYYGDQYGRRFGIGSTVTGIGTQAVGADNSTQFPFHNKLRPIARKHIVRGLSARTDVSVSPLTGRPQDIASTKQARGLLAHFAELFKDEDRALDQETYRTVVGPGFEYIYFDPRTVVPMPKYDGQTGEMVDYEEVPAGELRSEFLPYSSVFPDPRGNTPDDWGWVIIATRESLRFIAERWENGWQVKPDPTDASEEEKNQTDAITSNQNRDSLARKYATVLTLWEQPSDQFPQGLYCVMSGGVFLEEPIDWPYTKMRDPVQAGRFLFPVVPLVFEKGVDSFWGENALTPLLGLQRSRNILTSKIERHCQNGDGKIIALRGAELPPGAFRSGEPNEVIYVGSGLPSEAGIDQLIKFFQLPAMDPTIPLLINLIDKDLDEIGEVNAVSKGQSPYAGAPGVVVQALQDADNSSAAIANQNRREFLIGVAVRRLALAEQYYTADRLLFVQDSDEADPDAPRMAAFSFKEFGSGRYHVTASTSTPKTPAARMDLVIQMFKAGAFLPEALPATMVLLRELEATAGEKWVDDLIPVLAQYQQQQQQKAAQAAQSQQTDAQTKQTIAQQNIAAKAEMQAHEHQAESEQNAQKANAEIAKAQASQAARVQADTTINAQQHQLTMEQIVAKQILQGPNTTGTEQLGQESGAYPNRK